MRLPDELGIDLICPECRRPLARIEDRYLCTDGECRRAYSIHDGIPKLIVDDATILGDEEWAELVDRTKPHKEPEHGQACS